MSKAPTFQISALPLETFRPLFGLDDEALRAQGARRCRVDAKPGYPCRVSLEDAAVGETVILLPYEFHHVDSPYRASGPIYVRENARQATLAPGELPPVLDGRQISVRAYNAKGLMRAAEVLPGDELKERLGIFFADSKVAYLHLHNALPGCYSCRVDWVAG